MPAVDPAMPSDQAPRTSQAPQRSQALPPVIASATNPRVKALIALRRRRVREQTGRTVLEGLDELRLAVAAGVSPREVYLCPELLPAGRDLSEVTATVAARGAVLVRLGPVAFARAAYREHPDGVLAVVDVPGRPLAELAPPAGPLLLVAQGVEKPGNLGAMVRTADAAGVAAVLAADPVTDWGNPNVIRASKGTVFAVPVTAAPTAAILGWLRERGIRLVATTPAGAADYTDVDYGGPLAVAVGAEAHGLTDELLAAADLLVRVPMSGRVNSLNVATTAAVVVFEALRQRRSAPASG